MKKRPVTWISMTAFIVLLVCLSIAAFNSGLQYRELLAEGIMHGDAALIAAIRAQMERANLFAVMASIAVVFPVYLVWWLVCAYVISKRMRAAGISRGVERCCLSLLPFAACGWWSHVLLNSRPAVYHYEEYRQCLLAALASECCGVLLSAAVLYVCCHLTWRRRIKNN